MEENKTQCIACLHDAHVESKIRWVLAAQNDAAHREACEAEELHARFGEPHNESSYGKRAPDHQGGDEPPRDFKSKIRRTGFIEELKYTHRERPVVEKYKRRGGMGRVRLHLHTGRFIETLVDRIDRALNEYHRRRALREEQIERERRQREQARAALVQIRKQFAIAENNPILAGAILAAFQGFWSEPHEKLQQSLHSASDAALADSVRNAALQEAMRHEASISEIVQRIGHAIDSMELPKNTGGRPPEPELDRLILELADVVVLAREKGFHPICGGDQLSSITRHSQETIAHIVALMTAGNVPREPFTIATRLEAVTAYHPLVIPIGGAQQAAILRIPPP